MAKARNILLIELHPRLNVFVENHNNNCGFAIFINNYDLKYN